MRVSCLGLSAHAPLVCDFDSVHLFCAIRSLDPGTRSRASVEGDNFREAGHSHQCNRTLLFIICFNLSSTGKGLEKAEQRRDIEVARAVGSILMPLEVAYSQGPPRLPLIVGNVGADSDGVGSGNACRPTLKRPGFIVPR